MSNGDHNYKYAVVYHMRGFSVLCFTDSGEPAIYNDAGHAELFAANRRTQYPGVCYHVISFQVL